MAYGRQLNLIEPNACFSQKWMLEANGEEAHICDSSAAHNLSYGKLCGVIISTSMAGLAHRVPFDTKGTDTARKGHSSRGAQRNRRKGDGFPAPKLA